MERKLFKLILIFTLICLIIMICTVFYGISIFGSEMAMTIVTNQMLALLMFSLLAIFSLKRKVFMILFVLVIGLVVSSLFEAVSLEKWVSVAFPKQIISPQSFIGFVSGIGALCFILIFVATGFLLIMKVRKKLK